MVISSSIILGHLLSPRLAGTIRYIHHCYLPFAYSSRLQMVLNPGKILPDSSHLQTDATFEASHMQSCER